MDLQNQHNFTTKTIQHTPHLVSVKKMIGQANSLINRNQFNKIYSQAWENIDNYYNASLKSTQKQCKNVCKMTSKCTKYECLLLKANLGNLIYDRFPHKNDSLWKIGENYPMRQAFFNSSQDFVFDSRFESGNLKKAYVRQERKKGKVFSLVLENDTNTYGYNQWFYFKVESKKSFETIKIQIVNMRKSFSLFNRGMKVAVFSENLFKKQKIGWHRSGNNIEYDLNGLYDQGGYKLSTLSFEYTFQNSGNVYFAYSYPYTFSQLQKHLKQFQLAHKEFNIKKIGLSALKNEILLVEEKQKHSKKNKKINTSPKQILLVMARVHPGQTVSSFVIKGFLNSLVSDLPQAQYLKSKLSIKIIPMQNPDGVIHGNTRTSLTGNDLNRRWIVPSEIFHPQIFSIKKYIQNLENQGHKIFGMVDLHGHTKKQSSFFYGCCSKKNYNNHFRVRLLNFLMGTCDKNFKPQFSSFYVSAAKKSTARVTFFNEICNFSYTLQSSFMAAHENMLHYSIKDYEGIGRNLLKSLAHLKEAANPTQSVLLDNQLKRKVMEVQKQPEKIIYKEEEQSESGSSSNPSQFNYSQQFLEENTVKKERKNVSSKRYRSIKMERVSESPQSKLAMSERKSKKASFLCIKVSVSKFSKQNTQKLPLLSFESREQKMLPTYQLYNFKSRKINLQKKKIISDRTLD